MLAVTPARDELLVGVAPLRRQHRQAAEALDAAKAGGALDDLQPIEEPRGAIVAAAEIEADHAAEAAHLALRDGVIGVRLEARVVDALDASALLRAALATASALAFCRSTRTASVLSPRPSAYAAYGSRTAPTSLRALSTFSISSLGPASAPAVTSLWPLRYFVALCITTSTPSASGC